MSASHTEEPLGAVVLSFTLGAFSIVSSLAAIALLCAICVTHRLRERSVSTAIVQWMSFSDLGLAITFILGAIAPCGFHDEVTCKLFGGAMQFFSIASIIWSLGLAVFLNYITYKRDPLAGEHATLFWCLPLLHAVAWIVSAASVLWLHASFDALGYAGNYCWIRVEFRYLWLPFYYIPLLITLAYNIAVFMYVMSRLRGRLRADEGDAAPDEMLRKAQRRLLCFTVIFFFYAGANLANRLYGIITHDRYFPLALLQSVFAPLQALGDALIYFPTIIEAVAVLRGYCKWWEERQPSVHPSRFRGDTTASARASSASVSQQASAAGSLPRASVSSPPGSSLFSSRLASARSHRTHPRDSQPAGGGDRLLGSKQSAGPSSDELPGPYTVLTRPSKEALIIAPRTEFTELADVI